MNYKKINSSIIEKQDYLEAGGKTKNFYKYLIGNNVGYYYSKIISKTKNNYEARIVETGDEFNKKYTKTLRLLDAISKKNNTPFLLFKTYKYVPEAVDGDIDIIVKEKDFHTFLEKLEEEGFICDKAVSLKASCMKEGFLEIEPRVNISFHGVKIVGERDIWNNYEKIELNRLVLLKTNIELDILSQILNILYGPNYVKLYLFLIYKKVKLENIKRLTNNAIILKDLDFFDKKLMNTGLNNKFPLFLSNISFLYWWINRILLSKDFKFSSKIRHIVSFFYLKYEYLFFGKLHFMHNWEKV